MLRPFVDSKRCIYFMPAIQGATRWFEPRRGVATILTDEARTPFTGAMFDRVVVLHAIEEAESTRQTIRELQRIMVPNGGIVVSGANRHGIWTRAESTRLVHGRSYTLHQLKTIMSEFFQITASSRDAFMPPLNMVANYRCGEFFGNELAQYCGRGLEESY